MEISQKPPPPPPPPTDEDFGTLVRDFYWPWWPFYHARNDKRKRMMKIESERTGVLLPITANRAATLASMIGVLRDCLEAGKTLQAVGIWAGLKHDIALLDALLTAIRETEPATVRD